MARPGRKSAAQTPAPPSERIKGSSKNPKGTASSKKSASGIRFSAKTLKSLSQKRDEHNSKYKRKASLPQLKAVYRRGLGAFSSSHRPTITGGAPNSRNAWAMARVNKFLMKLAGKKVKAAYVQDDDLMEDGGVTKETTTEFMNWFAGWVKPLRGKMNIGMSIPNEYSQIKGVDDFVFLDVFDKIGQDIDAKPHLKEILSKADELGVSLVLEPIPRHHEFLDDAAKRKKIDRQYLIGYYSKFGFSLMDNGLMHRMPGSLMADRGGMNKLIVCRGCGWRWNTADSDESDKYVCHQCGFDNRTYYDADPIGTYANHGQVLDLINQGVVELKMFNTTPEHAKEYGLDSKRPLYLQKIYISKQNTLKGIGSKVIEYIIDYAKKNEHDLIFGHITQKAEPNIDVIKSMLREAGFNTIDGNDDFYKTIDTKYAHGGLIAPNGKPSNLTPEQYRLVRTPAFKAWFGDWENDPTNASKVVDENGEPLIVWHSSINNFDVFNKSKSIKGLFHFGTISQALDRLIYFLQEIGIDITPHFENIDDENDEIFEYYFEIAYWLFMYVYYDKEYLEKHYKESLSKRKQKAWEILKKHEHNVDRDMLKKILSSYNTKPYFLNIKRLAETKDVGEEWVLDNTINDGYKYLNVHEGNGREFSYVVFEPNQIKLADGSNVTFVPNNPDIRYKDGGQVQLLAPNGKPSNLTPEQYRLVRTPAFKAWFGDWENDPENASKVVDDNGEPKVVYHGSRSQFTTFDLSKGGESNTLARVGFWFSPNEGFGLNFTAGTWWGDIKGDYGIEYAVFLSIKNPKVFEAGDPKELFSDSYERFKTDIYAVAGMSARDANIGGLGMALNNPRQTINDYRSMLKKDGYDGILIKQTRFDKRTAGDLNDQIVALYPEQIKLADGSNVNFDPNNPDIRYAKGGRVALPAPNGKPSKLTPEQYRLVRTPAFKAWFGDWENDPANASKVVDENGEPLTVWHFSKRLVSPTEKFYVFNVNKQLGAHFGSVEQTKSISYTPVESDMASLTDYEKERVSQGYYAKTKHISNFRYYQAFLNIRNPIRMKDTPYWENQDLLYALSEKYDIYEDEDWQNGERYAKYFSKKYGVDGVVYLNRYEHELANITNEDEELSDVEMRQIYPQLEDSWIAFYPEQIKLADGSNTTFDINNPDIRFDEGGKIEKMAETLELTQNSAQYAAGGSTDDCGCGDKAEFGMETNAGQSVHKNDKVLAEVNAILGKYGYEAIKKGEYPIGKVAKGMTIEDIARRHRFPIQDMKKSLELGIRTEKEHTNDQLIAEKIALDHLYEDAEYYQKLQKIEKLYKGSEIDYDFNPMDYYVERDDKRTSVSLYLRDEKMEANNVLFSNEMKLSKAIICREKINHAIEQENKAINSLEKNFWQAVKNIWENCMVMLTNHYYHAITNVENSYSLQDVYTYANGGLAYGNSHSKGGIPLYNKGSKSWIEIEGGEGVVKKESMHMNKALEFQGKKMSACEIVSQINQMTGGVKFKCADVKKIMDNDGNYD